MIITGLSLKLNVKAAGMIIDIRQCHRQRGCSFIPASNHSIEAKKKSFPIDNLDNWFHTNIVSVTDTVYLVLII